MELRHLRYFLVLAEELHFGRAAKRLNIAQPPLSIQIMQLEAEMKVRLFDRGNRKVSLTKAGHIFAIEAQQILHNLERAVSEARKADGGELGQLRIGVVSSALYTFLPSVLTKFRSACPEVRVELKELSSSEQVNGLLDDRLDVGIFYPLQNLDTISTRPVLSSPLVIAIPSAHPLAHLKNRKFEDFGHQQFIVLRRSLEQLLHDEAITVCREHGFSPEVVQEANTIHSALGMVASSLGIAIVPAFARSLRHTGIVFRDIIDNTKCVSLMLATTKNAALPIVNRFLSCFETE